MTELLDHEEFRLWLATREPDEVVGVRSAHDCAISTYLKEGLGFKNAATIGSHFYANDRDYPSPSWVPEFVYAHDEMPRRDVTAKEALTILDSIEETS